MYLVLMDDEGVRVFDSLCPTGTCAGTLLEFHSLTYTVRVQYKSTSTVLVLSKEMTF
jgi:hypothetical protein